MQSKRRPTPPDLLAEERLLEAYSPPPNTAAACERVRGALFASRLPARRSSRLVFRVGASLSVAAAVVVMLVVPLGGGPQKPAEAQPVALRYGGTDFPEMEAVASRVALIESAFTELTADDFWSAAPLRPWPVKEVRSQ